MAEKRMFSMRILGSDAFLDLPLSAQALYLHLCIRADDDGFLNNAKAITRLIGASDEDLKILIKKRFLLTFESGVIVIKHWQIHNVIRKDRRHSTQYRDEMATLKVKENGAYTELDRQLTTKCQPIDNQMSTTCQTSDGQLTAENRIDKNRIDKNRLDESIAVPSGTSSSGRPEMIFKLFNEICGNCLSKAEKLTDKRKKILRKLPKEYTEEKITQYFQKVINTPFLTGDNDKDWRADFDWLIKEDNIVKVLEGKYDKHQKKSEQPPKPSEPIDTYDFTPITEMED